MEDEAIVELFFCRSESAIRETEIKYGKKLLHLSANMIGSEQDAQECVNDAYLAAWNTIPPTRPENYFAYLCRIVRNLSYKLVRRNTAKKRSAETLSLTKELSEIIPDDSFNEHGESELGKILDAFLTTLDTDARMIFVRRYFFADSLAFIASLTGTSENSIATRLFRMRNRLKAYLKKEGFTV